MPLPETTANNAHTTRAHTHTHTHTHTNTHSLRAPQVDGEAGLASLHRRVLVERRFGLLYEGAAAQAAAAAVAHYPWCVVVSVG